MKKYTLFTALLTLLFAAAGRGQDAHFSQMLHTGGLLNPGKIFPTGHGAC